jgi:hypothetical protein
VRFHPPEILSAPPGGSSRIIRRAGSIFGPAAAGAVSTGSRETHLVMPVSRRLASAGAFHIKQSKNITQTSVTQ